MKGRDTLKSKQPVGNSPKTCNNLPKSRSTLGAQRMSRRTETSGSSKEISVREGKEPLGMFKEKNRGQRPLGKGPVTNQRDTEVGSEQTGAAEEKGRSRGLKVRTIEDW